MALVPGGGAAVRTVQVPPRRETNRRCPGGRGAMDSSGPFSCPICLEPLREPVTLPCGHNFCGDCIRDCWGCCEKACPECREPFPDGAELRRNVALGGVLEVVRAGPASDADPGLAPGPASDPCPGLDTRARCPRHGRPLELFCRTEGLCVCSACTVHECRLHERALLDVERREREVTGRGTPPCSPPARAASVGGDFGMFLFQDKNEVVVWETGT